MKKKKKITKHREGTKVYYDKRIKALHKVCWSLMSKYVRIRDKGICFTCGIQKDIRHMNAGHFRHNRLDYDEMNINCQCVLCNKYNHGELGIYGVNLVKKYGQKSVDDLITRSRVLKKYSEEELIGIKTYLENKLEELKKEYERTNNAKNTREENIKNDLPF